MRTWARAFCLGTTLFVLAACGNGGQINFMSNAVTHESYKGAPFSLVPASQALAVEAGKTASTGYHAKLQVSLLGGTQLKAANGYSAKMKFTVRHP